MLLHHETLTYFRLGQPSESSLISWSLTYLESVMSSDTRLHEVIDTNIRLSWRLYALVNANYLTFDWFFITYHSRVSSSKFYKWYSLSFYSLRSGYTIFIILFYGHSYTSNYSYYIAMADNSVIFYTYSKSIAYGFIISFCIGFGIYFDNFLQVNYKSFLITISEFNFAIFYVMNSTS